MKTITKIAVMAMMGMSLGVQAQENKIETTGNVGIGTLSPSHKLHVKNSSGDTFTIIDASVNSGVRFLNGVNSFIEKSSGSGSLTIKNQVTNGGLNFGTENVTRMTVLSNGNVGIGTTNPQAKLNVQGTFQVGTTANYDGGVLSTSYENGSLSLNMIEYDDPLVMSFKQTLDPNYHEKIYFNKGGFGIGISDTKGFKLGVNGKVAATEVKVATYTNWSDFVFYDNYELPTLTEVEKHIKEKGHLKDIPSAKEVEKNGFFLGEMDAKLLQKIEELTLYTIEQDKNLKAQKEEIEELKKQNSKIQELEKLVKQLLKDKK